MRTLKPRREASYAALLPYNDETRKAIEVLRKGRRPGVTIRLRGRGPNDTRDAQSHCSLENADYIAVYISGAESSESMRSLLYERSNLRKEVFEQRGAITRLRAAYDDLVKVRRSKHLELSMRYQEVERLKDRYERMIDHLLSCSE